MKILIICTGNSCRSQMAHGFMQSFGKNIEVYSAGTKPAEAVNEKAIEVMSEVGIDISDNTPTNISNYLKDHWDCVITVCGDAEKNCPVFQGMVKYHIHIGFDDPSQAVGTDQFIMSEFRRIRDQIKLRLTQLYKEISALTV